MPANLCQISPTKAFVWNRYHHHFFSMVEIGGSNAVTRLGHASPPKYGSRYPRGSKLV